MSFDGEQIAALQAAWRALGKKAVFVATETGAYLYDAKNGETLQFVTPEGMRN